MNAPDLSTLDRVYREALQLDAGAPVRELAYRGIAAWDSIGHMTLIAGVEETFGVMLETEDVLGLSSYAQCVEILRKYGVEFAT